MRCLIPFLLALLPVSAGCEALKTREGALEVVREVALDLRDLAPALVLAEPRLADEVAALDAALVALEEALAAGGDAGPKAAAGAVLDAAEALLARVTNEQRRLQLELWLGVLKGVLRRAGLS